MLGYAPRARCRARVQPGELVERGPLVVYEVLRLVVLASFDQDDLHAPPAQLVGKRAPARAGADDDDDVGVAGREAVDRTAAVRLRVHDAASGSGSQSRSSKPRLI